MDKVLLGDILTESKVESLHPDPNRRITVRLNVKGVEKRPVKSDTKGATKYYTRSHNQFIYGKQNLFKGAFGIIPEELDGYETSSDLPCFDIDENRCKPEWIYYFFKKGNFYKSLEKIARGAGSKRISPKDLFKIEILLPTLKEQEKVLTHLKSLEKKGNELNKEIQTQQTLLKKLRQSILQEAIEGKLTAKWREKNPDVEPASVLLEKIRAEKEQLVKEKKIRKQKPLPPISQEETPFEIPKGWEWCRLGDIFITTSGGTPTRGDSSYWNGNISWLKSGEMNDGLILKESEEQITEKGLKESSATLFPKGTLLIAMYGATAGKLGILTFSSSTNQAVCGFYENIYVSQNFLFYFLKAMREKILEDSWGQSQPNISQTYLKSLSFPLPPLEEQKEIVKKIESLFKLCDALEEQIEASKANSEMLMQAVLREAFEG